MFGEKNNITAFFNKLEDINVLEKDYNDQVQKAYADLLRTDVELVSQTPYEYDPAHAMGALKDGRFYSDYKGAHFEAYFKKGLNTENLIVTFRGARSGEAGNFQDTLPVFSRWSWSTFIDGSLLCFEDPMYYKFPKLKLGWFYGTEDEDYAVYAAEIIQRIADDLNVERKNIILYASSGGGTAAIRAGAALSGSRVVAINPQLDIRNYNLTGQFIWATNMDLNREDPYSRNDLAGLIRKNPETQYLLIINGESRLDIEVQLKSFLQNRPDQTTVNFGLSKRDNVAVWIYDGPGSRPHNVMENYRLYPFIRHLLDSIEEKDFVEKHRTEVMYINDWWRFRSQLNEENRILEEKCRDLENQIEQLHGKQQAPGSNKFVKLSEEMTARIDIINKCGDGSDEINDLNWIEVSDGSASLSSPSWFVKNGRGYVLQADKGEIDFTVQCIGDGKLEILLRGICKRDQSGKEIPCWIDYTEFVLNQEIIFLEKKSIWHNKPYKIARDVKDGDMIQCILFWEKHTVS